MKNKKKFRIILVLLLLGVTLGYAVLGANLTINGNSKLSSSTWDIHFNNVVPKTGSVTLQTGDHGAAITQGDNTEVTYAVTLSKPGDFYEFNVDAVNAGTVDGMINTITSTYKIGSGEVTPITSSNLPAYLSYSATYSDGGAIAQNHLLKAGETETYKVRIEFKRDIENNQLPSTEQTLTFNFAVDYIQADSNAIAKPRPYVYTVNHYSNDGYIYLNQAFPTSITKYNTPSDALTAFATASSNNLPFYLKHKLENGIVTESYVEFVVTPEMAGENTGMVAGTYTLRGEKTFDSDISTWLVDENYISPYYESNKEAIKTAFGYATNPSRCSESGTGLSSNLNCSVSDLYAGATGDGGVVAYDNDSSTCYVDNEGGESGCYW